MTTYTADYAQATILSFSSKVEAAAKAAKDAGADIIVVVGRNHTYAPVVATGRAHSVGKVLDTMRRKGWLAVGSFMCGQWLALEPARVAKFATYMASKGVIVHQIDGDRAG